MWTSIRPNVPSPDQIARTVRMHGCGLHLVHLLCVAHLTLATR